MSRSLIVWACAAVLGLAVLKVLVLWVEPRMAFFPFPGEQSTPERYGVGFEPVTLRTADGERLRAWWIPAQAPKANVVYFHGNGGNLSLWTPVLVGLHRQRVSVLAVDYRGYGLSTGRPSERGLYRDVDATLAAFDEAHREPNVPTVYWGRSLGTAMAAYAASRRAPDGVVLEAGFPSVRSLLTSYPVLWVFSWFASYRFPTAEWMRGVAAPTLVMHGTDDSIVPYQQGRALYDQIGGPKRFHVIQGGDHNDPVPVDAETYWKAVDEFVGSLSPR
jgi:uncharacterized protein